MREQGVRGMQVLLLLLPPLCSGRAPLCTAISDCHDMDYRDKFPPRSALPFPYIKIVM